MAPHTILKEIEGNDTESGLSSLETAGEEDVADIPSVDELFEIISKNPGHGNLLERNFATLSREEELRLARAMAAGNLEARNAIILAHQGLVRKIAHHFKLFGINARDAYEELVSEGNIGLLTACKKFDPDRGYRFFTYASWWIRSQMFAFVIHHQQVSVTRSSAAINHFWKSGKILQSIETAVSSGEPIEKALRAQGLTESGYSNLINLHTLSHPGRYVSLDHPLRDGSISNALDTLFIPGEREDQYEALERRKKDRLVSECVEGVRSTLNARGRRILDSRIFPPDGEEPMALVRLGDEFGVTGERIRQVEEKLRRMLRIKLAECLKENKGRAENASGAEKHIISSLNPSKAAAE